MRSHRYHWVRSGVALLLAIALPACVRAAPATVPTPTTAKPHITTIAPPTMTLPTFTSAPATAEPTPGLLLISGPGEAFRAIQFSLPTTLAGDVSAQVLPASETLGELYPVHAEFTLLNYDSQNTSFEPQIQIYPVRELDQSAAQTVQELKDMLAGKPTALPPSGIPILPTIPARQLIDAQIQYLTFTNGSGIRVLTQFAQAWWPINNEGLVYIFQGLTSDDAYYISAFLPVTAPFLPDHVDDPDTIPPVDGISYPKFNSPNFDAEFLSYVDAITHKLNATSPEGFAPDLSVLDNLIESLQIESTAVDQGTGSVPCVNALPTRLSVGLFAYVNPDPPVPNNIRSDAGKNNSLIGDIRPGKAMKILEGPKCADGWVWWKVRTVETELEGWTPEGDQQNYWLIPCASRNACGP